MSYEVIRTNQLYKGKTYNDWAKEYFTWYFSKDPDDHNDGPVVFLKSTPRIDSLSEDSSSSFSKQMTEPNVMIGRDRLDIRKNQAILIPAIVSYFSMSGEEDDLHTLKNFVREAARDSEIPSDTSIRIRRQDAAKGEDDHLLVDNMLDYSLETDVFMLDVPEGSTYARYVEYPPLMRGNWPTVGNGFFFLVRFLRPGVYAVTSNVRGKPYRDGIPYHATLMYEIHVT